METNCTCEIPDDSGDVSTSSTYAYAGIPVIFVLAFLGSLLPPITAKYFPNFSLGKKLYFIFFNGFAGGLILSVGYVHSIPDAMESFSEALTEDTLTDGFAWGTFIAMMGSLIIYIIEIAVEAAVGDIHSQSSSDPVSDQNQMKEVPSSDESFVTSADSSILAAYYTEMLILFGGLTFHSVFVGIALGISGDDRAFFIAIVFHQFFEGVAFGARIAKANVQSIHIWIFDFLFSISCSVGIAIGLGVKSTVEDDPYQYRIVNGVFQGLSGGILIYIALIHMINDKEIAHISFKSFRKYAHIFGVFLGAGAMSVIGIWG